MFVLCVSNRFKTSDSTRLANAVASSSKLSLLQDIIPQTVPLKVAKAHREGKDPVPNPPDALHSMLASVQEQLKAARGYSGTGHKQGMLHSEKGLLGNNNCVMIGATGKLSLPLNAPILMTPANATNTHRPYSQREARALSHNSKKSNTTGNSSGRSQQAANSGLIPLPNNTMGSLPLPPGMQIPPGMQLVAIPPGFDYRNMPPPPPGMTYAPVPITFSPTGVPIINTTPTTGSGSGEGGYGSGIRWVHNPSSSSTSTPNMNANATTNASGGNGSGSGGESTPAHLLSSHQPPQMQSILQQSSTSPPQSQSSQQGQGTWTVQTTTAPILSSSTDANNANSTFGVLKPAGFSRSKKKKNDSTSTPAAAAAPSIGSAQAPSSSTTPAIPAEAPITKSPPSSSSATIHPSQLQGRTIYNTGVGSGSPSKAANHSSETPASITPNEVNTTSEEQQQITPVKRKGRKSTRGGGT